jgi:hypothetical protein
MKNEPDSIRLEHGVLRAMISIRKNDTASAGGGGRILVRLQA